MTRRRLQNGKKMENILKAAGPTGATIKKADEWDLSVYILAPEDVLDWDEEDNLSFWVEMCASKDFHGDLLMDPLMRICLKKDQKGQIIQAIPKFYQSDNLVLGRMEINEKGEIFINRELVETNPEELDERLENWLHSIDLIGYLREPNEIIFHKA